MHWMVKSLGGGVAKAEVEEYGEAKLHLTTSSTPLFKELKEKFRVWMSHSDKVTQLPSGFEIIAKTRNCPAAAIASMSSKLYGVQFHPEVIHTEYGGLIISNFLRYICNCKFEWEMESFINSALQEIRTKVGGEKVLCALSGGVDSSTVAALVHKAIKQQLVCVFVNNGLLRKNEVERVIRVFRDRFNMNLIYVDAERRFLHKLKGVVEPEEKRKLIGEEFIRVFEEEASKIGGVNFLAQGTLYPDVIESKSVKGPSSKIKSHHNVGGLPERMNFKLIEPLRFLFKDEVRVVAEKLGLPREIILGHPFPGPGLAVRVIGEVTEERLKILREADWIVTSELKNSGLYEKTWQTFAILLPIKTVGVMGDGRTYENVVAVRSVVSVDGMTADWADLPRDVLQTISSRIINEVPGVNRVVYDITSKPPGTIEWE
jgi:GMP synthase (glutamine-hydrolysing)